MEGHIPVLCQSILRFFQGQQGILLDGTFGGGGHSQALLEANPDLSIVALDQDPEAKSRSVALKQRFGDRFTFYGINFSELGTLQLSFTGILFDLGLSSFQLDCAQRGFSFSKAGPLDMRMNPDKGISAQAFLHQASKEELTQAIRDYGEEPQWRSVVEGVLRYRDNEAWNTTTEWVQFLEEKTTLYRSKKPGIHFATRVFQGLRIWVNQELKHLQLGLTAGFQALTSNGLLAVISFHSLEDRMVKKQFNEWCGRSIDRNDARPQQLKVVQAQRVTTKPIRASEEEIASNPRSRSAKLRIIRKL